MSPLLVRSLFLFLSLSPVSCKRPNIVLVLADDLGYGDLPSLPARNLQRLRQAGLDLTSHYAQPTCTPSRQSGPL